MLWWHRQPKKLNVMAVFRLRKVQPLRRILIGSEPGLPIMCYSFFRNEEFFSAHWESQYVLSSICWDHLQLFLSQYAAYEFVLPNANICYISHHFLFLLLSLKRDAISIFRKKTEVVTVFDSSMPLLPATHQTYSRLIPDVRWLRNSSWCTNHL